MDNNTVPSEPIELKKFQSKMYIKHCEQIISELNPGSFHDPKIVSNSLRQAVSENPENRYTNVREFGVDLIGGMFGVNTLPTNVRPIFQMRNNRVAA